MMNIIRLCACTAPSQAAIFDLPLRIGAFSLSMGLVVVFALAPALAGGIETDPAADPDAFLHCAETESEVERLHCFDQYMRLAGPDIGETLGPAAADLTQCTSLIQESVRTACFDAAANIVRDSLGEKDLQSEDSGYPKQPEPGDSKTELGQEQLETVAEKNSKKKTTEISATVIDLKRNAFGLYSFHLDNGQIWQQTERERFVPPDNDFPVEIKKGAVSGYRLHLENQNKILRVKRLQ
jgi:hypothetical protein